MSNLNCYYCNNWKWHYSVHLIVASLHLVDIGIVISFNVTVTLLDDRLSLLTGYFSTNMGTCTQCFVILRNLLVIDCLSVPASLTTAKALLCVY